MVEATVSIVLVATMFVAAVRTVSVTGTVRSMTAERVRGVELASALLQEILEQPYTAPAQPLTLETLLGGVAARSTSGDRAAFDDVSDYHNYVDAPPVNRDGSATPGAPGYRRSVLVRQVKPDSFTTTSATDTGVKLVTVTVTRGGRVVARLSAVRVNLQE
jgi:hypothetical protein